MSGVEKYISLREEFLSIAQAQINSNKLETLKGNYADCINSTRKLNHIKDLRTLIKILEKRDILRYDKIEPFCYISKQFVDEPYLKIKLIDYQMSVSNTHNVPLGDMYPNDNEIGLQNLEQQECNTQINPINPATSQESQGQSKSHMQNVCSNIKKESALEQTVLARVSDRLGRSWRDVARHLGIRECEIDAIQNKYPCDLKEQCYAALRSYISQCGTDNWTMNLMRALEKGRRRDLREVVEELVMASRYS